MIQIFAPQMEARTKFDAVASKSLDHCGADKRVTLLYRLRHKQWAVSQWSFVKALSDRQPSSIGEIMAEYILCSTLESGSDPDTRMERIFSR